MDGGQLDHSGLVVERAKCSSSPGCDEHWQRNFPGAFWLVGGSLLAECQNYLAYIFNTGLLMCGFVVTTNRAQGQVRQSNGHEKPPSPYFRSCPLHARFQESLTQSQWNVNLCPTIPMVCTNESDNCSKFLMLLFWGCWLDSHQFSTSNPAYSCNVDIEWLRS